jgi:hypothetical protein
MTTKQFNNWAKECKSFENWYKRLGGDVSSPNQMQGAFNKIEAKNVNLQNPIHKFFT